MPTLDTRDIAISRKMQKVGHKVTALIRKELGEEVGMALIVFPWSDVRGIPEGTPAHFQYISSAPRRYMFGMLKELLKKWDSGQPDTPTHLQQ